MRKARRDFENSFTLNNHHTYSNPFSLASRNHGYVRTYPIFEFPFHPRQIFFAMEKPAKAKRIANISLNFRESFDNIYLDLSKESGKCRFAETGLGWKPTGGGDTFTLDHSNIAGAQWSRAAKGYEVKILLRNSGIVQLDGFLQEVSHLSTECGVPN